MQVSSTCLLVLVLFLPWISHCISLEQYAFSLQESCGHWSHEWCVVFLKLFCSEALVV